MSSFKLTKSDKAVIEMLLDTIKGYYDPNVDGGPYNVGEIYLQGREESPGVFKYTRHNNGLPKKYVVVHVSDEGIPFLKELGRTGKPSSLGKIWIPYRLEIIHVYGTSALKSSYFKKSVPKNKLVLDPEYVDSLILDEEYHPMAKYQERCQLLKEIKEHNKRHTLCTLTLNDVIHSFASITPGTTLWTTINHCVAFEGRETENGTIYLVFRKSNGEQVKFTHCSLISSRFYTQRPRSFKKEAE